MKKYICNENCLESPCVFLADSNVLPTSCPYNELDFPIWNKSDYFLKWVKTLIKRRENEKEKAERGAGSTAGKHRD